MDQHDQLTNHSSSNELLFTSHTQVIDAAENLPPKSYAMVASTLADAIGRTDEIDKKQVYDAVKSLSKYPEHAVLLVLAQRISEGRYKPLASKIDHNYGLVWSATLEALEPKNTNVVSWTLAQSFEVDLHRHGTDYAGFDTSLKAALPFTTPRDLADAFSDYILHAHFLQRGATALINRLTLIVPEVRRWLFEPLLTFGNQHLAVMIADRLIDLGQPSLRHAAKPGLSAKERKTRTAAARVYKALAQAEDLPLLEEKVAKEKLKPIRTLLHDAIFHAKEGSHTPFEQMDDSDESLAQIDTRLGKIDPLLPKEIRTTHHTLPKLVWKNGTPLSDLAQQGILSLLGKESAKHHDPTLIHLTHKMTAPSKLMLLDVIEPLAPKGWSTYAIAYLGNDAQLQRLGSSIDKTARSRGGFGQAERHLRVLERNQSNTALYWINRFAERARSVGIRTRAKQIVHDVCAKRGIPEDELGEHLMDDLGFDIHGKMTFSYGSKTLILEVKPDGVEMRNLSNGKLYQSAPKATKEDDEAQLAQQKLKLSNLKKQLKQLHKEQVLRLERSYVTARTWSMTSFTNLYLKRPILTTYAKSLLWSAFSPEGELEHTFRVDEALMPTDIHEESLSLSQDARIALAHPIYMTRAQIKTWMERLAEYEVVCPINQLERPIYTPTQTELEQRSLARFESSTFSQQRLHRYFAHAGWDRGLVEDAGYVHYYTRAMRDSGRLSVMTLRPGFALSPGGFDEDQNIEIFFITSEGWHTGMDRVPPTDISKAALSEIIQELTLFFPEEA